MVKIHWFIKEWRDKLGLTQEQLAERCHTNKGQINKLENGKQRMNDRWIQSIAHALEIAPYRLLMSPDTPTADDLLIGATDDELDAIRKTISMMLKK